MSILVMRMEQAGQDRPLILFDGVCNLCNRFVDWMIRRDKKGRFLFASNQSEAAAPYLTAAERTPGTGEINTIYLVWKGRTYSHSGAILRIWRLMGFPYVLLWPGMLIPWFLRDAIYNWVARNRYRWFGKRESCRLPTPEERSRFLN